jgi:LPXTG-motif cell wall-anchored protein
LKKLTSFGAVGFAALIALLALAGFQSPAQAYPEAQIDLRVDHQTVTSGESFTATASSDVHCSWKLEWDHKVSKGESSKGSDFVSSFRAKPVKSTTKIPLNGTCTYDADGKTTTATRTIDITVKPKNGGSTQVSAPGSGSGAHSGSAGSHSGASGSDLPNTGGPNRLFLAGGLVLLMSGAAAVTLARRRAEEAELQVFRA